MVRLQRYLSSVFVTVGAGRSPLTEKHLHMALATEAREGPTIQDKGECLMAATGHLFEDMTATFRMVLLEGGSVRVLPEEFLVCSHLTA